MKHNAKQVDGFTLTEMLVVTAVIAVLAALLLPVLSAAKIRAQRTACMNNLRQINLGVRMYSDDSNDTSPARDGVTKTNSPDTFSAYKELMKNYVGSTMSPKPLDSLV